MAEEVREPERTLPRSLVVGTALVALLYAGLNVVFIYGTPLEVMKGIIGVGGPAARALFGPGVGGVFSALMAFALLSSVNAMAMIGPRIYYAMAGQGAFFGAAWRIHPSWNTPWVAILAQGGMTCVLIVTGTFESLVQYIGFSLWLFTALAVARLLRLRNRSGWKRVPAANFAFPLLPAVYIAVSAWCLIYMMVLRPTESRLGVLTIALGAAIYATRLRSSGRKSP